MDRFPMSGENVYEVAARMHEWDKEPSKAAPDLAKLLHKGPKEQKIIQEREQLRTARANAELAAIGHQSGYAPNLPGQGSALDHALRALHQPAAQPVAPAPQPAERRAAPASPVNALVGSRPDLLTRALKKGIMLERVKTIQGQRCQTSHCSNNAAWRVNGRLYCNVCAEKLASR